MDDECWNEPSEIRIRVLVRLKAICQEILGMDKVPPAFWAFCQVADIAKLEEMIQDLESTNNTRLAQRALEPTIMDCSAAIDRWLQRLSVSKSSSHPSNHSERSDTETRNCKKRDNHNCVLTRTPDPDAAHIYPNSLLNASKREPNAAARFWSIMNVFWDEGRVQR
ncbi:hypothetical protein BDV36DRAFT_249569 [Aspergillus pseudocaelatus]|uniref:HNH nuclease domain-containing protein n=1 Tax=Aspergillus pseudocaelatus TaxID=1825620 RepID=A0ABQ6WTW3_9EURO|nr:hypothetical protein BDV36DRAFT_249569 [Aspergillus pseudocaelatus]